MKNIKYDCNELNINRMVEVERSRINHIKSLNQIYKKRSNSILRQERQLAQERHLRQKNQFIDKERKWRQTQSAINYQNSILRNKLMDIYIPKQIKRTDELTESLEKQQKLSSLYKDGKFGFKFQTRSQNKNGNRKLLTQTSQNSTPTHKKIQSERQLHKTNAKFFMKLSSIKSELMPKLNLSQHEQSTSYYREMLKKKNPKKQLRFKKIIQRNISQHQTLDRDSPKLMLPHHSNTYRDSSKHFQNTNVNPETPYIFY